MRRVLADYWRFCSPKYIPRSASAVRNFPAESLQPAFNQHTNPCFAAPLLAGCRTMATGDSSASPDIKQQRKNRLVNEKSPYLLQHASNPVDWWAAKHGMHSYEGWLENDLTHLQGCCGGCGIIHQRLQYNYCPHHTVDLSRILSLLIAFWIGIPM